MTVTANTLIVSHESVCVMTVKMTYKKALFDFSVTFGV